MGLSVALLAITAASAAAGAYQSYSTARKQEKAGEKAAVVDQSNTREEQRKLGKQQKYQRSLAKARAGASGVGMGGSVQKYLEDLKSAGKVDMQWLGKVGASRSAASLTAGKLGASASMGGMWNNLGSAASSAYSAYSA